VLREIVAAETGDPTAAPSTLFTPELHAEADGPNWHGLPALLVDTNDPAAGFLASLPAADPDTSLALLEGAPEVTLEVRLRRVRMQLDAGDVDAADQELDGIADDDPWEWRVSWYRGLVRLGREDARGAVRAFEVVYRAVPGELAPKLALGAAHEADGRLAPAAHWYDIVSHTDRAFTSAAFGLARCRLAADDLDGALVAYGRVPVSSSAHQAARIATAEALLDDRVPAGYDHVVAAAEVVRQLRVGSEQRAELTARVLSLALSVSLGQGLPADPLPVLDAAFEEQDLRIRLETAYRELARYFPDTEARFTCIDRANDVRPRTLI
jgi:serine/threonine-protein kinase PknG